MRVVRRKRGELLLHNGPLMLVTIGVVLLSWASRFSDISEKGLFPRCLFRRLTGIPCLACGLTRSFLRSAHGEFAEAFSYHLLGPPLFLLTVLTAVYLAGSIVTGHSVTTGLSLRAKTIGAWMVLALFMLCWILKLLFFKPYW